MSIGRIIDWITASRRRTILVAAGIAVLIVISGFFVWALTPLSPMDEAIEALRSDEKVEVHINDWIVFEPLEKEVNTGFIIYPGGRVDPRSYAPMAKEIAAEGFLVVIAPMTLNLAFFSPNEASDVMEAYPGIETWVVGGHSLGGAMAARFVHRRGADGLVLWAAYPADDMSDNHGPTILIYGTRDGVTTVDELEGRTDDMPVNTVWISIEGGNHAQFGWYGDQRGDNEALLSRHEQQELIVTNTVDFLSGL